MRADWAARSNIFTAASGRSSKSRWKPAGLRDYVATLHRLRTDPSGTFSIKLFWRDLLRLAREIDPLGFRRPPGLGLSDEISVVSREMHRRIYANVFKFFPRPVFVLLKRRDTVRQAVSFVTAAQTRVWRKFGSERGKSAAHYDFDKIVRMLATIQKWNADWLDFMRANDLPYYEIAYEDLLHDYDATLRQFFAAVGRRDAPIIAPRLRRQADALSDEFVEKFLAEFRQRARS